MFIELTDHLCCPADHEESFLVLLPEAMDGRDVRAGELGCPICGRTFRVTDGVAELTVVEPGVAPPREAAGETRLSADAIAALLGLSGPGGYYVLVGRPGAMWGELLERMPGVAPVVVNPPDGVAAVHPASVVRSGRIPLKARSVRGVVLGPAFAGDPHWVAEAARVLLPGLRAVGDGGEPADPRLELLATAEGTWVAERSSGR